MHLEFLECLFSCKWILPSILSSSKWYIATQEAPACFQNSVALFTLNKAELPLWKKDTYMCIYTKIENNISIYNYLVISIIYLYLLWVCLSYLYVILLILLFLLSQIAMLPQGQHQIWSLPDNDLECLLLLLSHSYSITTSSFRSVLGYVHVSEGATETKNPKCTGAWGRWLWTFDIDLTLPVRALHTRDLWAMSPVSCTIFMWCRSSNPGLLCMLGKYSTNWATPQNCHSHLENEMFYRYWKFWNFLLYRG